MNTKTTSTTTFIPTALPGGPLKYTLEVIEILKKEHSKTYARLKAKWNFEEETETSHWREIVEKIYFAYDPTRDIFLQQEGFLDKELIPASALPKNERPLNQNWSWGQDFALTIHQTGRHITKVSSSSKMSTTWQPSSDISIFMSP